jgi:hypothetical protein
LRVAIDLDNTIVDYGAAFVRAAFALGLIPSPLDVGRARLRALLRASGRGDVDWQRVQAAVYGPGLRSAQPFVGVREFITESRARGARLFIVSHKTRFAAADSTRFDLRFAARCWLRAANIVGHAGIAESDVYFHSTRASKIKRIRRLRCTHAIDDLSEVFDDPSFPKATKSYLFSPDDEQTVTPYRSWRELSSAFFDTLPAAAHARSVVEKPCPQLET